jgi:hypothetical protein
LLVSGLRIKCQPDQVSCIRHVSAGYHTSCPSGAPQSVSV